MFYIFHFLFKTWKNIFEQNYEFIRKVGSRLRNVCESLVQKLHGYWFFRALFILATQESHLMHISQWNPKFFRSIFSKGTQIWLCWRLFGLISAIFCPIELKFWEVGPKVQRFELSNFWTVLTEMHHCGYQTYNVFVA